MRIITRRIYRAFPELDDFTDKQCKLLMQRVRVAKSARAGMGVAALGMGFIAFILGLITSFVLFDPLENLFLDLGFRAFERLAIASSFLIALSPGFVTALITRDLILRRMLLKAIRIRIDKVRCPKCKYILIGQSENNGAVTCPECGQTTFLKQLGLEPRDLIPPESAADLTGRRMGETDEDADIDSGAKHDDAPQKIPDR